MVRSSILIVFALCAFQICFAQDFVPQGYELVWSDEFDGDALDMTKWSHRQLNKKRRNAFNSDETVKVENGVLELSTILDSGVYKTSMISTYGTYEPTYGYYETKVKLQKEVGHWSAFWLQTPNVSKEEDTVRKEIDIFEYLPNKKRRVQHALHKGVPGVNLSSKSYVTRNKRLKDGWHIFGFLWTPDSYTFYINGVQTYEANDLGVSQNQKYLILSLEVGPWAGNIQRADLPDSFSVDYVRVYQ